MPGGRMPAKEHGRPAQAPGVGKRSERHDLETRDTPYLHGSDLQQGDVQEIEAGRKALKQTQPPARTSGAPSSTSAAPPAAGGGSGGAPPDYISLMAGRQTEQQYRLQNEFHIQDFLPMASRIMTGSRSSGLLHRLFIRQLREIQQQQTAPAVMDMRSVDAAIEETL